MQVNSVLYCKGRVKHTKITLSNKITLVLPHRRSGDPQCFLLFCIVLESYRAHCTMSFLVGVLSCLQFYSTYIVVYIHAYIHAYMHSCHSRIHTVHTRTHIHTHRHMYTHRHTDCVIFCVISQQIQSHSIAKITHIYSERWMEP